MGIWVGRYAIVGGAVREHGPWFLERERSQDDGVVRLLILVEPIDERSAPFCEQVADAVAELFIHESASVTGGLLRAIRRAHANLEEWNRRSLREHRVAVGITCAVIRDGEVTIAQAGPGVVYVRDAQGLRRLAPEAGTPAANPLGGVEAVDPAFSSERSTQSLILLVSSVVEQRLGVAAIGAVLEAGPDRALAELFTRTRAIQDMTAVLVAEIDLPDELLRSPSPELHADSPAWADSGVQEPTAVDSGPASSGGSGLGAAVARGWRSAISIRTDRAPYADRNVPGALGRLGVRRAGERPDAMQQRVRVGALVGVAVLALVLLGWCTLPSIVSQDRSAQCNDAMASAATHLQAAAQATDVTRSRTELQTAASELARARAAQPTDGRIAGLQAQIDQAVKGLDAVSDLGEAGLKKVLAFDGVITAPFTPAALAFGDGALWLLDSQRGRVFRIDLAGGTGGSSTPSGSATASSTPRATATASTSASPTAVAGAAAGAGRLEPVEVYRPGATYGGSPAREPRVITWDATGRRLLLLDTGPTLFSIASKQEPTPIAMRGAKDLRSVAAIATYSGNLYALDPASGEIWRYLPGGGGFDSERSGLLGGIEMADARGLLVDGDFYVLGTAGVRRFRPPRELPPLLQGIDRPLASPAGLAADSQRQLYYAGDRGGHRVVVSNREGAYRRQYRHPQFIDVRGVALSADGATAYVLTGEGIFSFAPAP